jgi:hypothetical protein
MWLLANAASVLRVSITIVVLFFVVIQAIVVVYGMATKATIAIGFTKGWLPSIEVKGPNQTNTNATPLESTITQPMVRKQLYEEMVGKYEETKKAFENYMGKSIQISHLPPEVQGSPNEAVSKIGNLVWERQQQHNSVWYCCYVIAVEIAQNVCIDTNLHNNAANNRTIEVYRCMQVCLNVIGYYEGEFDGDQGRTKAALAKFQQDNDLTRDYKLGKKTWCAILKMLAEEIHGNDLSELVHSKSLHARADFEDVDQEAASILSTFIALLTPSQLD